MRSFAIFFRMIKFEHSLFALPFAFTGMFLASRGLPDWQTVLWVVVAMIGARSGAMGLNRLIDAEIDKRNPRTQLRDLPAGNISKKTTFVYICLSLVIYFIAAFMLNKLAFMLSPIPVAVFVLYSFSKRFTNLCHVILGVALGLAPVCAWIAVKGAVSLASIILACAVILWVTGFDILYAIQDIEIDRKEGLFSIPSLLGVSGSIIASRIFHGFAFLFFLLLKPAANLGYIYLAGVLLSGAFMVYEHSLVSKDDITKLNMAFFNINAYISITISVFTIIDLSVLK